jgi:hypothetical protein
MTRYLLAVNFKGGVVDTPMEQWKPEEIEAHLDYYKALHTEQDGTLWDGAVIDEGRTALIDDAVAGDRSVSTSCRPRSRRFMTGLGKPTTQTGRRSSPCTDCWSS